MGYFPAYVVVTINPLSSHSQCRTWGKLFLAFLLPLWLPRLLFPDLSLHPCSFPSSSLLLHSSSPCFTLAIIRVTADPLALSNPKARGHVQLQKFCSPVLRRFAGCAIDTHQRNNSPVSSAGPYWVFKCNHSREFPLNCFARGR